MVATQPDIAHVVGIVRRFMHKPGRAHWSAVNHIFKYVVGRKDFLITFMLEKT